MLSIANSDNKPGRFDGAKFSQGCRFRKCAAIEPLRLPDLKAAPDFPKCLLQISGAVEPLSFPLKIHTDNQQGRFDSTNFYEGCRFRKLGAIEPLCFPKMRSFDSTKFQKEYIQFQKMGYHIHGVFYNKEF